MVGRGRALAKPLMARRSATLWPLRSIRGGKESRGGRRQVSVECPTSLRTCRCERNRYRDYVIYLRSSNPLRGHPPRYSMGLQDQKTPTVILNIETPNRCSIWSVNPANSARPLPRLTVDRSLQERFAGKWGLSEARNGLFQRRCSKWRVNQLPPPPTPPTPPTLSELAGARDSSAHPPS